MYLLVFEVFSCDFSIHEPHWCSLLLTSPLVNQSASGRCLSQASGRCNIQSGSWRNALEVEGSDESSLSEDGHTCRTKNSAYPIIGQKVEYILDGLPLYCSHLNGKCLNWTTEIIRMYKNSYERQVIKSEDDLIPAAKRHEGRVMLTYLKAWPFCVTAGCWFFCLQKYTEASQLFCISIKYIFPTRQK